MYYVYILWDLIFFKVRLTPRCAWCCINVAAPHWETKVKRYATSYIYIHPHTHTHTHTRSWLRSSNYRLLRCLEFGDCEQERQRYFCFVNLIQPIQSKIFLRFCSSRFTWETRGERHGDCDRPSRVYDPTCSVLWIWFRSSHHFRRGGGWWWQTKKNRYSISLCFSP